MLDFTTVATNIEQRSDGIWYARQQKPIDYPDEGNAFCYQVEEGSFWFNHRNSFILEALRRFPPNGVLFDIGGGNGYVAMAIQRSGCETVLLEPGIEGIRNAQRRGLKWLVCATLENAGLQNRTIPAIGLFDVLEHIPDDRAFIELIHRLLVPGGRLYLTVPAYQFLWSIEDDFARHYRRYTLRALSDLLKQTGFMVDFATYIFATLPVPIYLFRTLPSVFGWRKPGDLDKMESELKLNSDSANTLLDISLRLELFALQRFNKLPFGGSCLIAAHKIEASQA